MRRDSDDGAEKNALLTQDKYNRSLGVSQASLDSVQDRVGWFSVAEHCAVTRAAPTVS